jgi:hypothetical protein
LIAALMRAAWPNSRRIRAKTADRDAFGQVKEKEAHCRYFAVCVMLWTALTVHAE